MVTFQSSLLYDLAKAFDNVDHFFFPKMFFSLDSMTLLSLDSPLTYLAVLSNPLLIPLFSCSHMLGVLRVLFFVFCSFYILSLYSLFLKILFIFWLCWVFVAVHWLSLVAATGGYSLLWYTGFSLQWLLFAVEHGF